MTKHPGKVLYRIGDYARFMGVSADLLKHYEKLGLIQAETAENGYRYYPFHESTALLECKRLQNYGLSLREMHQALREASFDQVRTLLDDKINLLAEQLKFQQMVIDEHHRVSAWMAQMQDGDTRVTIEEVEPFYFLPHSSQRDFIQDERIPTLLPAWLDAMPLVKSCRLIPSAASDKVFYWGLAVTQAHQEALKLPLNDVVQRIEGGRYLHVHFRHRMAGANTRQASLEKIMEIMHSHDIDPQGPMLQFMLMRLGMNHERTNCGWFCAPLRGE